MKTPDKWSVLAGLRFALASIVALDHLSGVSDLGIFWFLPKFGAFQAILGFLLVSGYSVSTSYLKEPDGYLLRRLKRIYPIYFASIVVTLVARYVTQQPQPSLFDLLASLLFLNQLVNNSSVVGPAWSLSLEVWLYCLAPFLLTKWARWNRSLVYFSFASFLLYTCARTLLHAPYYFNVGFGANLVLLSFIWICGLRLAKEESNQASILRDIRWIFAAHILCDASIQFLWRVKHHSMPEFFSVDLLTFALQAITLWMVVRIFASYVLVPQEGTQRSTWLRVLGDVSYPLYLVHLPLYLVLHKLGIRSAGILLAAAMLLAFFLYWSIDAYSKKRHLKLSAA